MARALTSPDRESRIIRSVRSLWRDHTDPSVVVPIGDDCAVVRGPAGGMDQLVTVDQLIEGSHFLPRAHPPEALGRKALVRSLSDIAAMGGLPVHCLQTVCLPPWANGDFLASFQQGMRAMADEACAGRLTLIGGDVARGGAFVVTVTVIGKVERDGALRRSGARPGDSVHVSGQLGGSDLGLQRLLREGGEANLHDPSVQRHIAPVPRLSLGRAIRSVAATAAIDLSDGLATDACRLAGASGVAMVLDAAAIPRFGDADLETALRSGEEYELLFTLPRGCAAPDGFDTTEIGRVEEGSGVTLREVGGSRPLPPIGFRHCWPDAGGAL